MSRASIIAVLLILGLGLSHAFADEVVYATDEDLDSFDKMLSPPTVEFQAIPNETTKTVEIDTQSVKQRGNYGLIISDEARQLAPQRGLTNPTLRGVTPSKVKPKTGPTPTK